MEEKKHTEKIILGLSCCTLEEKCKVCPYRINKYSCEHKTLMLEAVDLIQVLQEEKKKLEKRNGILLYEKDAMEANCITIQKQVEELEEKLKSEDEKNAKLLKANGQLQSQVENLSAKNQKAYAEGYEQGKFDVKANMILK